MAEPNVPGLAGGNVIPPSDRGELRSAPTSNADRIEDAVSSVLGRFYGEKAREFYEFTPFGTADWAGGQAAQGYTKEDYFQMGIAALVTAGVAIPSGMFASSNVADRAARAVNSMSGLEDYAGPAIRAADRAMDTGQNVPGDTRRALEESFARSGSIGREADRLPQGTMMARPDPMGVTGLSAATGAGSAYLATEDFDPQSFQDWLNVAIGGAGGAAMERAGAAIGKNPSFPNAETGIRFSENRRGWAAQPENVGVGDVDALRSRRQMLDRDITRVMSGRSMPEMRRPDNALTGPSENALSPNQSRLALPAPERPSRSRGQQSGQSQPATRETKPRAPAGGQQKATRRPTRPSSGQGQGTDSPRRPVSVDRTASLQKSSKVSIAKAFKKSRGKLTVTEARKIAPKADPSRIKAFIEDLKTFRKSRLAYNEIIKLVDQGKIKSIGAGTTAAGAAYNALSSNQGNDEPDNALMGR